MVSACVANVICILRLVSMDWDYLWNSVKLLVRTENFFVLMYTQRVNKSLQSVVSVPVSRGRCPSCLLSSFIYCSKNRKCPNLLPPFTQHLHCLPVALNHTPTRRERNHQHIEIQCCLMQSSWLRQATWVRRGHQTSLCLKKQVSVTQLSYMRPLHGKPPVTVYMIYLWGWGLAAPGPWKYISK